MVYLLIFVLHLARNEIMVIKILLILSIIIQLSAAIVAIGLTRKTKYNLSWMLFTVALTCMAFLRFGEYIQVTGMKELRLPPAFFVWMGITTSLCFAVGVLLVKKIFNYITRVESQRRITERRILNTIIRTEEKERQRFSKDLHDGLGPLLSSAKMSLSALGVGENGGATPQNEKILRNTIYVIDEAIRSLREISVNLSPHILNNFGLARALSNYINKLPRTPTKVNFTTNLTTERIDPDVEVILYRVICELINNSLKHAGAMQVVCKLTYTTQSVEVDYRDDGSGFVMSQVQDRGMGFSNIASRISSLKGEFTLTGIPNQGMSAHIHIQL